MPVNVNPPMISSLVKVYTMVADPESMSSSLPASSILSLYLPCTYGMYPLKFVSSVLVLFMIGALVSNTIFMVNIGPCMPDAI